MLMLRSLIGMPVVCGKRRIGRLIQADLSDDLSRLDGIWIAGGLRGARYIPSEDLELIGEVAVLTDSPGSRGHVRPAPLFRRAVSTDGRRLGAITGARVDPLTLAVTGLELSAGLWDDLIRRRGLAERYTVNRKTGEVIIESDDSEREESPDESRIDQGTDRGHADRRLRGDDLRRDELADGAALEPEGQADRQLDRLAGGSAVPEAVGPRREVR